VLAAIRDLNRLECAGETLRHARSAAGRSGSGLAAVGDSMRSGLTAIAIVLMNIAFLKPRPSDSSSRRPLELTVIGCSARCMRRHLLP
jgi:hypothetical protein